MAPRETAYLRHQQMRWLRCDAHRWIRPDCTKFLKPGTDPADVYPALARQRDRARREQERAFNAALDHERALLAALRAELNEVNAELAARRAREAQKYSPSQPRVPAGSGRESGRWTDGGSGGESGRPRVVIDTTTWDSDAGVSDTGGDAGADGGSDSTDTGSLGLFDITPRDNTVHGGVRLAGDPPQQLPPIFVSPEPPEIPPQEPPTRHGRMSFVRNAVAWITRVGRSSLLAGAFLGAVDQIEELNRLTDMIRTANDPPETLDVLQSRIGSRGYHRHHIAEEAAARDAGDPESRIQGRDNLVGVPILKHIDITAEYNRKVEQPDGRRRSPREVLEDSDFETRRQYGLDVLRRHGVLR